MRVVRLIDALAMTLVFVASLNGLVQLVTELTPPATVGQVSVVAAKLGYVLLGLPVMWGWRKRRTWLAPVAWTWGAALTYTGGAATRFYGNAAWRDAGASLLAGGIIAAVTVYWITQRNVLAPMPPARSG